MSISLPDVLLSRLHSAGRVVAFTGAGVSAESGVPTFRGTDGLWGKFRPEELASFPAFMKNPALVWEWYRARKEIIATVQPNAGHRALAAMEGMFRHFALLTQNIDNLHRRAGSRNIFELHGNIERNYCLQCGRVYAGAELPGEHGVPVCETPGCGGMIRPDVVWFGEMLPDDAWDGAVRAAALAEVFFSVGTSGVVYPAASLPLTAKGRGAFLVEVNPEPTPLTSSADLFLRGPSGDILPAIVAALKDSAESPA